MTSRYKRFDLKDRSLLKNKIEELSLDLPLSDSLAVLGDSYSLGAKKLKNRLAVHPMEGCDGAADGSPTELIYRRYSRFAKGGSGLLWVEACAVCHEGRANPRQLYIHEENKEEFKKLADFIRKEAEGEVYLVLQLTHSGRYAKPTKEGPAVVATQNPYLDKFLPPKSGPISDAELDELQNQFVEAAKLAKYAGFDAVDVKACHRYLNNELLSAFERPGRYGGSYENRTRFLFETVQKIRDAVNIDLAVRMNAYDEIPYPFGFGVDKEDFHKRDLSEAKRIVATLYDLGVRLVNITGGNPYYNPHVNRPYDLGTYTPPFHPLENVYKLLDSARQIKAAVPEMTILATGFTWLREYGANMAAACIEKGWFDLAGFGRQAFAYPDFAADITEKGGMVRSKCCITCSKCTVIMRDGGTTGCVIKDSEVYLPIYNKGREGKPALTMERPGESIDPERPVSEIF